jgi:Fe-S cluster assembly protein SufB
VVHGASNTSSRVISKSISKNTGRTSYRGLVKVHKGCKNVKSNIRCDALLLDDTCVSDTYPYMEIDDPTTRLGHEATVSKLSEDQLFYLMSRGLSENEATAMLVSGFIEPIVKELPMEFAVEMNRLIEVQLDDAVG